MYNSIHVSLPFGVVENHGRIQKTNAGLIAVFRKSDSRMILILGLKSVPKSNCARFKLL